MQPQFVDFLKVLHLPQGRTFQFGENLHESCCGSLGAWILWKVHRDSEDGNSIKCQILEEKGIFCRKVRDLIEKCGIYLITLTKSLKYAILRDSEDGNSIKCQILEEKGIFCRKVRDLIEKCGIYLITLTKSLKYAILWDSEDGNSIKCQILEEKGIFCRKVRDLIEKCGIYLITLTKSLKYAILSPDRRRHQRPWCGLRGTHPKEDIVTL